MTTKVTSCPDPECARSKVSKSGVYAVLAIVVAIAGIVVGVMRETYHDALTQRDKNVDTITNALVDRINTNANWNSKQEERLQAVEKSAVLFGSEIKAINEKMDKIDRVTERILKRVER